jgi:hypothetical protein
MTFQQEGSEAIQQAVCQTLDGNGNPRVLPTDGQRGPIGA